MEKEKAILKDFQEFRGPSGILRRAPRIEASMRVVVKRDVKEVRLVQADRIHGVRGQTGCLELQPSEGCHRPVGLGTKKSSRVP